MLFKAKQEEKKTRNDGFTLPEVKKVNSSLLKITNVEGEKLHEIY
jgi:hypothetical protein